MAFETRTVLHVDGKTTVKAKGRVVGDEFVGEYKYQGMTYGVTINLTQFVKLGLIKKVIANNSFRNLVEGEIYDIDTISYSEDDFVCNKGDMIINGFHYSNFDIPTMKALNKEEQ